MRGGRCDADAKGGDPGGIPRDCGGTAGTIVLLGGRSPPHGPNETGWNGNVALGGVQATPDSGVSAALVTPESFRWAVSTVLGSGIPSESNGTAIHLLAPGRHLFTAANARVRWTHEVAGGRTGVC